MTVRLHPWRLSVCSLPPDWSGQVGGPFGAFIHSPHETTLIVSEGCEPEGARVEGGWTALEIEGPIPFDQAGVLLRLLGPLAAAGIPIFAVSTFDSDVVLIRVEDVDRGLNALAAVGIAVVRQ